MAIVIMRVAELWESIGELLNADAQLTAILGGESRVEVPSVNPIETVDRPWRPNEAGGRVIFLPRSTLWPSLDEPGDTRNLAFLTSVQFNDFRAAGYDVNVSVDAAHERLYRLLDGYAPVLERVLIFVPLWRHSQPPPSPVYDQQRRLWLSNAEWRAEVAGRAVIES